MTIPADPIDRTSPVAAGSTTVWPEVVADGALTPTVVAPPVLGRVEPRAGFPVWLKVMAGLLSVVKGAPLVLVALFGGSIATGGTAWSDVGAVLVVLAIVPLLVLVLQLTAAVASLRVTLLIVSTLLLLVDLYVFWWNISLSRLGEGPGLFTVMAGSICLAQLAVLFGAISSVKPS